jgi:hypothetical protein
MERDEVCGNRIPQGWIGPVPGDHVDLDGKIAVPDIGFQSLVDGGRHSPAAEIEIGEGPRLRAVARPESSSMPAADQPEPNPMMRIGSMAEMPVRRVDI